MTTNNLLILRGQSWYSACIMGRELRIISRSSYAKDKLNLQGFRIIKTTKPCILK